MRATKQPRGRWPLKSSALITEAEYVALAQESFKPGDKSQLKEPYEYWGFDSQAELLNDFNGLTAVKDQFLPRTGLTYDGLAELLSTNLVRGRIPDALLKAPGELADLWSKVRWAEPKSDDDPDGRKARWGDLLAALDPPLDVDMPEATDVIVVFPKLPNMAVIFPTGRVWKPGSSERSVFCDVYFSKGPDPLESERIGRMDHFGTVHAVDSWRIIAWIDDRGVWRAPVSTSWNPPGDPDVYMYPPFNLEENKSKVFWLKNVGTEKPVAVVPRVQKDDGTVVSGEMTILDRNAEFMKTFGPAAGTDVVGWRLPPVPQNGEPDPQTMSIRCLGGTPLSLKTWTRINWFIRVMKRLGWSIDQTDRALSTFESDLGSPALLEKMALLKTVQKMTGLSLDAALILLGDLNTTLYRALFEKPSVIRMDPDLALASNGVPKFAKKSNPLLAEHATGVGAALGISPAEITTVVTAINRPIETETLSLFAISLIYKHLLLCKALNQPLN